MEGSRLDLADVVHAQIPGERKRGELQYQSVTQSNPYRYYPRPLGTCGMANGWITYFSYSNQLSGVRRSARKEVRGLGREGGGHEGGGRKLSPMNHCWAAVISSSSQ